MCSSDLIRLKIIYNGLNLSVICDVPFYKLISRIIRNGNQVIQISGVGEFIQIEDVVVGFSDLLQDEVATYEACATCNNYFFQS